MWQIEYSNEVKFYFLDNYPYTFDLHVRIETLKFYPDAIPPEGLTPGDDANTYLWLVLEHLVVFEKHQNVLLILYIRPVE